MIILFLLSSLAYRTRAQGRGNSTMGTSKDSKPRSSVPHHNFSFTPGHMMLALLLIVTTYGFTRFSLNDDGRSQQKLVTFNGRHLSWPERGYGSHLSVKIYVYEEAEIDGLETLLYGTDGNLSVEDCARGRWGSQVYILILYTFISEPV